MKVEFRLPKKSRFLVIKECLKEFYRYDNMVSVKLYRREQDVLVVRNAMGTGYMEVTEKTLYFDGKRGTFCHQDGSMFEVLSLAFWGQKDIDLIQYKTSEPTWFWWETILNHKSSAEKCPFNSTERDFLDALRSVQDIYFNRYISY